MGTHTPGMDTNNYDVRASRGQDFAVGDQKRRALVCDQTGQALLATSRIADAHHVSALVLRTDHQGAADTPRLKRSDGNRRRQPPDYTPGLSATLSAAGRVRDSLAIRASAFRLRASGPMSGNLSPWPSRRRAWRTRTARWASPSTTCRSCR